MEIEMNKVFSSEYLYEQISNHLSLFFPSYVNQLFQQTEVRFMPYCEASNLRKPVVAIPNDISTGVYPKDPYKVSFNGTSLTLWNRIQKPL